MASAWLTDRGRQRPSNEDAVGADPAREVYVVADGLGGLPGGEVASRVAVDALLASLSTLPRDDRLEDGVRAAVARADAAVRRAAKGDPHLHGMATTVVLAVGARPGWVIAHVGDSRAYLLRGDRLSRLTRDHNVAGELVAAGRIAETEAQHHPGRNVVTRTLGAGDRANPDLDRVRRQPGDRLLLCTDGLSAVLDDAGIERVLATSPTPETCCRELVRLANEGGGPDNVTVLVADS